MLILNILQRMYRNFPDFDKQEIKLTLLYVRSAFQRGKCGAGWSYKYIVGYFAIGSYDLVIRAKIRKSERKDKGKTQVFQVWLPPTVSYILSKDKECRAQRQGEKLALTFDQNKQILFLLKME